MAAGTVILNLYPPPPPPPPPGWFKPCSSSSFTKTHSLFTISCLNSNTSSISPLNLNKALTQIQSSGVIACLRAPSAELALGAAHAALDNGISVLEVVASCPGVFEVIQELVRQHPTKTIGVGTIINDEDAKRAMHFGADFLMSPAMVQDVQKNVLGTQVLYIPGLMTPTEILCAYNAGVKIVKVYPVSAIGGAKYIRALKKPFPHIPIVASQGITIDSTPEYIAEGASAVVLSDAIFNRDALLQGDLTTISKLARRAALVGIQAVKQWRLTQQFRLRAPYMLGLNNSKPKCEFSKARYQRESWKVDVMGIRESCNSNMATLR